MRGKFCATFFWAAKVYLLTGLLMPCTNCYASTTDAQSLNALRSGKVLQKEVKGRSVTTSKPVNGSESRILINAPTEKVWQVLNEKENLPKFVHQIEEVEVVENNGSNETVKTSVKICKLLPRFDYVLKFDNSQQYRRMTFVKTGGCFSDLFGCFEFIPYGNSTILGYKIFADPGFYIPDFVCKRVRSDAEGIMRAIKEEAEK